ncbi:hypothetical protein Tco_0456466 [Tanacetum coccineum]
MYDSWKSIMELYMMNRQHGRMILESVENGPLIWPTIEENGVTRPRKYSEWSPTDAIQADCDIKATNIIFQSLPPEAYALVSNHKVAKDLWEIIQLLMQGTSLTKQERECKLYDEFDKFDYKKEESLRDFYLRFALLLNDMNIYKVKLEQFQVNTKFLNTLHSEWSKFVTDVKLVRDLHTTNIDQLHAYLGQHEFYANEVCLMHERNSDPLALSPQYGSSYQSQQYSTNQSSTPLSITYPSNYYQSSVRQNIYSPSPSIPQLEYAPTVNQQPKFPQLDLGLTASVFKQGGDPIDAINHMMSFLSAVVTSRYCDISYFQNISSTNEVSTASGDFGISTAGGINQVSSTLDVSDGTLLEDAVLEGNQGEEDILMVTIAGAMHINESSSSDWVSSMVLGGYAGKQSRSESVVSNPKINIDRVIIEDWNSDDEEEEYEVQIVRPETQIVKTRDDKSGQNSKK